MYFVWAAACLRRTSSGAAQLPTPATHPQPLTLPCLPPPPILLPQGSSASPSPSPRPAAQRSSSPHAAQYTPEQLEFLRRSGKL